MKYNVFIDYHHYFESDSFEEAKEKYEMYREKYPDKHVQLDDSESGHIIYSNQS